MPSDAAFHFVAARVKSDRVEVQIDDGAIASTGGSLPGPTGPATASCARIGASTADDVDKFSGVIDEVRVAAFARSDDDLLLEFQTAHGAVIVGDEQDKPASAAH